MNKLQSICQIFNGYSFRGKVHDDIKGDTHVVQMKNLVDEYTKIDEGLNKIDGELIKDKYTLIPGDVLFISKGANNHAVAFHLDLPRVIASATFFVIRPNDRESIDSDYLAWYINQSFAQQFIGSRMAGTHIPNVNIGTIQSLPIKIPPLKVQKTIAQVNDLHREEKNLLSQILQKRETLLNTLLNIPIKNDR